MQDLFLTAFVKDGVDFDRASAVLRGLTNMSGWESTHRVLFVGGPLPPKGLAVTRSIQRSQYTGLWTELNQALSKISYILQARYEVSKDRDFGGEMMENGAEGSDTVLSGMLRWTDFPKPTENQPITQRKKIDIPDQKNIIAVLKDNNHRFKSEGIEESVSYFSENIEFTLLRHYTLPTVGDNRGPQPMSRLPAWSDLQLLDRSGTWMLFIRTLVQEDNSPEKVKKAADELNGVRERLSGVFDFKVIDRKVHDTRILQPLSHMPAPLPQTQRVRG